MRSVEEGDNSLDNALRFLSSVTLFRDVPESELRQILNISSWEVFAAGEIILLEGEATNDLLIISEGSVEVYISRDGTKIHITKLGPGAYFGEMSIFDDYPRSANVRAETSVTALRLDRTSFRAFLKSNPGALFQMCTVLSHRLRNTNSALAKH